MNPPQLDYLTLRSCPARRSSIEPASVPRAPLENFSSRDAVWLLIRELDTLEASEAEELRLMRCGSATVEALYQLVQTFVQMVRSHQSAGLDAWLERVRESKIRELQQFANGIRRDKAAVMAGLSEPYSNGVVEGHNTRLKLLKRMMYGRASFALLRQRVLYAA